MTIRAKFEVLYDDSLHVKLSVLSKFVISTHFIFPIGRTDGRVVKAQDSQLRNRGFESCHTLSLLYLKSLSKICTQNMLRFTQPKNENLVYHRESYCTLITCSAMQRVSGVVCSMDDLTRCWCVQVCRG